MGQVQRDRIVGILDHLAEIYKPEGVGVWLFMPHRQLGGRAPIELLRERDVSAVEAVVPPTEQVAT